MYHQNERLSDPPHHCIELFQHAVSKFLDLSNHPIHFGVEVDYFLLESADFLLDRDVCRVDSLDLVSGYIFAGVDAIGHVPERGYAVANHLIFLYKLLQTFLLQKNSLGDSLNRLTDNIFRLFKQIPHNRRCDLIPDDPLNNRILGAILKNTDKFLLHAKKRGELFYFAIDEGHSWCLPQRFQIVYEIFNRRMAALQLLYYREGYTFSQVLFGKFFNETHFKLQSHRSTILAFWGQGMPILNIQLYLRQKQAF